VADPFQPGGRGPAPAPLDVIQDFVNTEVPDWHKDDLGTPSALEAWLLDRGLTRPADRVDADVFVAARALRGALRQLALANTLGEPLDAVQRRSVDGALAAFPLVVRAGEEGVGLAPGGSGAARGLAAIVAIVAEARAGGAWERLKACRQESCGWLFYDSSRNRSSSWCSMQICGNREKSKAYRRRHRVEEH
jgi:predicted RNA-binding Zn ribbon-like protein